MAVKWLLPVYVTAVLFLQANALTCQRCTHVVWKGGVEGKGPDDKLANIVFTRWPRSCISGQGTGFDSELCAADGRHVCAYVMSEFSLIYAANVTVGGKTTVYNASAVGVAHIRGCVEEKLGCFKSLSDENRRYVADEVSQLVDLAAINSMEVVAKKGNSCTCGTNHCVAGSMQKGNLRLEEAIRATTLPVATAPLQEASHKKHPAVPVESGAMFPNDASGHTQQITNIYWIMELPFDIIVCCAIVVVACVKVARCRRRNRMYINVVRLSVKRQWLQPV